MSKQIQTKELKLTIFMQQNNILNIETYQKNKMLLLKIQLKLPVVVNKSINE